MCAFAAAALSSSAWSQTSSSGTAAASAPEVSTSAPAGISVSTAPAPLPGLSTAAFSAAASTETAAPAPASAEIPRPWVIGDIKASGLKNVKMSTIRGQIKARKGDLYDRPDLDRDIQSLLGLGQFERVGAELTLLDKPVPDSFRKVAGTDKQVVLTFTIKEKPVIRNLNFDGQKKLSKSVLQDEVSSKKSDPYDRFKLEEDLKKLTDKYHEKGFLDASASLDVKVDTAASKADVTFKIVEGPKSAIQIVELAGVKAFKPKKLLGLMKNERKKPFSEKDLPEDLEKIATEYKNNGYLDVVLSSPVVTLSPDKTRISIAIGVKEGRPYRFGESTFAGYIVYKSSEMAKTVEYRRGKVFNQEKFEATIRNIQDLYADVGRLRARVNPVKTYNPKTDQMDVRYEVTEGPTHYIDHVDIDGNKATKTYVIRREVVVKPGDVASLSRIKKSRERIMNLGFMDEVNPDIQPSPSDPEKVDLTFDVAEGKPGVLTAGAAYSSVDGLIGTLSVQHLNFLGRAQRVSANWSFGKRVQDYSVSWTTPWIGDSPTSLGLDLFHTRRINPFQGDLSAYTERRTGGSVRIGPRFQEDKYLLNFSYTLQKVEIASIDPNQNFGGALLESTSVQSLLGAELARDTRDSLWDPSRGTRHGIGATLSGGPLLGDIDFFEPTVTNQAHWTLYNPEDWPFVLSLYHRGGYVTAFGATKQVPVQNRFYVGGQDSLRGYSPSGEAGYVSGGKLYDVANVEFGFPLAREHHKSIVKLVIFADAGGAWDRARDANLRIGTREQDIRTDVGLGIRFVTPAFPIRLDYGYGLNHRPGEKLYQINFGLGPLF